MASGVRNSGHVTYSAQQMAFYQMCQRRGERVEAKRNHGVLEYKKSRNPLRAEKTPRGKDYKCFDFSIPEGRKDLKDWERWEYPEMDFGLMGKFNTQKHIYQNYINKHEDYKRKLLEFEESTAIQQTELKKLAEDAARRSEASSEVGASSQRSARVPGGLWVDQDGGGGSSSSRRTSRREGNALARDLTLNLDDMYSFDKSGESYARTARHNPGGGGGKPGRKINVPHLPLGDDVPSDSLKGSPHKISDFRMIAGINPEAVAKWRAKRAADFVTTQKHPLVPPTSRELVDKPFVVTIIRDKVEPKAPNEVRKVYPATSKFGSASFSGGGSGGGGGGGGSAREVNTGRLRESLTHLMGELDRTDAEIERHQLKLALKAKSTAR